MGILTFLFLVVGLSCAKKRPVQLISPYRGPKTVLLLPVLNYSGTEEIDMLKITDLFFSELQQVSGFSVIPVNRTLAQMIGMGLVQIQGPEELMKLAEALKADIAVVAAITEYNPYYPPIAGVAVQVYVVGEDKGPSRINRQPIDPRELIRSALPIKLSENTPPSLFPVVQVQYIFDSSQLRIQEAIKEFAQSRALDASPYGWRIYLKSQEHFLRFVWYKTTEMILEKLSSRLNQNPLPDDNNKRTIKE